MLKFVDLFCSTEHGLVCFSCFRHEWKSMMNKSLSFGVMKVYDCDFK